VLEWPMTYQFKILRTAFSMARAALLLGMVISHTYAAEVVVDIPTRAGVKQRFLYVTSDVKPRAAAVLFAGGHGGLNIYPNGSIGWADRSFLIRNRMLFANQGIAVAIIDAPSDKSGGLDRFRDTAEHATDVAAVIQWLRDKTGTPVWLVGHSRGTESALSTTLRLGVPPVGPDGLILTSSILTESMFASGKALTQFPLERLNLPLLVLYHESDSCSVTRPRDLPPFLAHLPAELPRKSVLMLKGGQAFGGACDMESHHSFSGQDDEAVESIASFMLK
ncbi:MAG: alpha/beta hydrolase, partial [Burkholderiaceae bacterium]